MTYEKPQLQVEKFTFEGVMGEFPSVGNPTNPSEQTGPVIGENDPTMEIASAFGEVLNFGN